MKKLFSLLTLALLTLSVGAANTYVKVTSANQLEAGKKYILVNEDNNAALGVISNTSTPYGTKVDVAISNGVVDIDGTAVVELTLGSYNSAWTFDMGNDSEHHYLVWTSGNSLNTATGLGTANTNWTASTTDDGVVLNNVADNTRKLQYNQSNPRFACYTSTQKPAVLYVQQAAVTVAAPTLPAAQNFEESLEVTITNNEVGATLYYSTDGLAWTLYTQPIVLTETTTVYAKASKDGVDSPVVSATYTKVEPTPEGVVVFVPATDKGNGSTNRAEWTVVKDGVTMNCSDGTVYDENYRIYQGATLTFSTTEGNITKIEFTGGDNSRPISNLSTNIGELTTEGSNGTWEGQTPEVVFTASAQARATEIRVYIDGEEPVTVVAAPTLPAAQNFSESFVVTITNNDADATLYYSTDGQVWTVYTEPITLTETTTIYAKASKNGVDSEVVSATYTKVEVSDDYIAFNCATDQGDGSTERGEWTIIKDGITIHCSDGTVYDNSYRIYKNATLTFTSSVGSITMIEFDGVSGNPISNLSTETGTLSINGVNGIWQGSATSVVFTASAQARATEFRVYINGDAPAVIAPVFDPTSCTFTGSQVVTLSCETQGATIYYSINDGEYQVYNTPLTLTATSVVKAYAELDGVQSSVNTATYTKRVEVTSVADAIALGNGVDFVYYGDVAVSYQWYNANNQYYSTWIVDDQGNAGLIYGKQVPALNQGDVLAEEWEAQKTTYNGIPEFQYPNNVAASGDTWTINPVELTTVTTDDVNKYIIMKGQTITADATDTTGRRYINADSLVIFNQFGVQLPAFEEGKTYDVIAIATIYHNAPELYIISATEVQATTVMRGDVNKDQNVNIADVSALIDYLLGGGQAPAEADCNLDQNVNIADVSALIDYLLSGHWID